VCYRPCFCCCCCCCFVNVFQTWGWFLGFARNCLLPSLTPDSHEKQVKEGSVQTLWD
jgi:hypothetical protein